MCGENSLIRLPFALDSGPSPRVWGEQTAFPLLLRKLRAIPTCVGRTRQQ